MNTGPKGLAVRFTFSLYINIYINISFRVFGCLLRHSSFSVPQQETNRAKKNEDHLVIRDHGHPRWGQRLRWTLRLSRWKAHVASLSEISSTWTWISISLLTRKLGSESWRSTLGSAPGRPPPPSAPRSATSVSAPVQPDSVCFGRYGPIRPESAPKKKKPGRGSDARAEASPAAPRVRASLFNYKKRILSKFSWKYGADMYHVDLFYLLVEKEEKKQPNNNFH